MAVASLAGVVTTFQLLPVAVRLADRPFVVPFGIASFVAAPLGTFVLVTLDPAIMKMAIAAFVLFTLVTLPVEIDASVRARNALLATGAVTGQEARGVSAVLTAAAATYVAAAITAIMQLVYFATRAGLLGRDDD